MTHREKILVWTTGVLAGVLALALWGLAFVVNRAPGAAEEPEAAASAMCPPATMSGHERRDCERLRLPSSSPGHEAGQTSPR